MMTGGAFKSALLGAVLLTAAGATWELPAQSAAPVIEGRVRFEDSYRETQGAVVRLVTTGGAEIGRTMTDSQGGFRFYGLAQFTRSLAGSTFYLEISYPDYGTVQMQITLGGGGGRATGLEVLLRREGGKDPVAPSDGEVSLRELNIPGRARREFQDGMRAVADDATEQAAGHFEQAIKLYRDYDAAYVQLSLVRLQMGQTEAARTTLLTALELNEENVEAMALLGSLYRSQRDLARSREILERAVITDETAWMAHFELAKTLQAEGRVAEADSYIERAHELNPQGPTESIHLFYFNSLARRQRLEEALTELDKFIEMFPKSDWIPRLKEHRERVAEAVSNHPQ